MPVYVPLYPRVGGHLLRHDAKRTHSLIIECEHMKKYFCCLRPRLDASHSELPRLYLLYNHGYCVTSSFVIGMQVSVSIDSKICLAKITYMSRLVGTSACMCVV